MPRAAQQAEMPLAMRHKGSARSYLVGTLTIVEERDREDGLSYVLRQGKKELRLKPAEARAFAVGLSELVDEAEVPEAEEDGPEAS